MLDGISAHFCLIAGEYLNDNYPGCRIGRGIPIAWPARSPDCNPFDFRVTLKTLFMQQRIEQSFQGIRNSPRILERVWLSTRMQRRSEAYIIAEGALFEHLYDFFV